MVIEEVIVVYYLCKTLLEPESTSSLVALTAFEAPSTADRIDRKPVALSQSIAVATHSHHAYDTNLPFSVTGERCHNWRPVAAKFCSCKSLVSSRKLRFAAANEHFGATWLLELCKYRRQFRSSTKPLLVFAAEKLIANFHVQKRLWGPNLKSLLLKPRIFSLCKTASVWANAKVKYRCKVHFATISNYGCNLLQLPR